MLILETRKNRDAESEPTSPINHPANMYMLASYGQNLGIYPIQVLHGPHIGFFAHIRPIYVPYW